MAYIGLNNVNARQVSDGFVRHVYQVVLLVTVGETWLTR